VTSYLRTEPLPPHVDKFENFYIRYTVGPENTSVYAEIWHSYKWTPEGEPVFSSYGAWQGGHDESDPTKAKPLCTLLVKWAGCSHLRMPYLHFDGMEQYDAFSRVVTYVYNDICSRHDVEE
jgi:hypothetical protein